MSLQAIRLAASLFPVQRLRGCLELQMLFDIRLQAPAAIFNADFLAVIKHMSVTRAEAPGTILTLPQQWFAASPQTTSVVAASGLVILANFHASRPAPTVPPPPRTRRRTQIRLTR